VENGFCLLLLLFGQIAGHQPERLETQRLGPGLVDLAVVPGQPAQEGDRRGTIAVVRAGRGGIGLFGGRRIPQRLQVGAREQGLQKVARACCRGTVGVIVQDARELLQHTEQVGAQGIPFAQAEVVMAGEITQHGGDLPFARQPLEGVELPVQHSHRGVALGLLKDCVEPVGGEGVPIVGEGVGAPVLWCGIKGLADQPGRVPQRLLRQFRVEGVEVVLGEMDLRQGVTQREQRVRYRHGDDAVVVPPAIEQVFAILALQIQRSGPVVLAGLRPAVPETGAQFVLGRGIEVGREGFGGLQHQFHAEIARAQGKDVGEAAGGETPRQGKLALPVSKHRRGRVDGGAAGLDPRGVRLQPADVGAAPGDLAVGETHLVQGGLPLQHRGNEDVFQPLPLGGAFIGQFAGVGLLAAGGQVHVAEAAVGTDLEFAPQPIAEKDIQIPGPQHPECHRCVLAATPEVGGQPPHQLCQRTDGHQGVVLQFPVLALLDRAGVLEQRDLHLAAPLAFRDHQRQGAIFLVRVLGAAAHAQFHGLLVQFLEVAFTHSLCSSFETRSALKSGNGSQPAGTRDPGQARCSKPGGWAYLLCSGGGPQGVPCVMTRSCSST